MPNNCCDKKGSVQRTRKTPKNLTFTHNPSNHDDANHLLLMAVGRVAVYKNSKANTN